MNQEKSLERINVYYHEELEKALSIMWSLLDDEMKDNIEISKHRRKEIIDFVDNFKFKYYDGK